MKQKSPYSSSTYQQKKNQTQTNKQSLSMRLRKISKNKPNTQPLVIQKYHKQILQNPQTNDKSSLYKTIQWNQIHLREVGHAHKIPRAKRFKSGQMFQNNFPLQENKSNHINGVTFAKSRRKQLFSRELTPSGADYDNVRYLQESKDSCMSHRRRSLYVAINRGEHIKGGAINKFRNYEDLYYPHTKKLQYNEKLIKQMSQEKKKRSNKSVTS